MWLVYPLLAAVHIAQSEVVFVVYVQLFAYVLEQEVATVVWLRIQNILINPLLLPITQIPYKFITEK